MGPEDNRTSAYRPDANHGDGAVKRWQSQRTRGTKAQPEKGGPGGSRSTQEEEGSPTRGSLALPRQARATRRRASEARP
eukprot:4066382-Alexandrium_andersonii.AAC.1